MNILASSTPLLVAYANWRGSVRVRYADDVLFNNPLHSLHHKRGESHRSKFVEYLGCALLGDEDDCRVRGV